MHDVPDAASQLWTSSDFFVIDDTIANLWTLVDVCVVRSRLDFDRIVVASGRGVGGRITAANGNGIGGRIAVGIWLDRGR